MEWFKKVWRELKEIARDVQKLSRRMYEYHVGAYAAQSAFFFILSMIPLMLLLLTIVQLTPITKADIMTVAVQIIPEEHMQAFLIDIINEVYNQSRTVIPITAITALWSASKAMLSLTAGLNCVYKCRENRNYVLVRISASLYTIALIVLMIVMLVMGMFGKYIAAFISELFPFWAYWIEFIMDSKLELGFFLIMIFSWNVYTFVPNNRKRKKYLKKQWIGASFTAVAWLAISYLFSMYLAIFQGFTGLYGSMTAIILVMLWLYFCMYAILVGGMFNQIVDEMRQNATEEDLKTNWFLW